MPATDESTLSPDTSFHPSTMVTLLVGPEEQEMTVHGDRLARNSAYFKAALRDEWLEGQTRVIKLVDESTEIMRHYIEYVYSGKPPTHDLTVASEARSIFSRHYPLLAEIYVIAERRLDAKCQNVIIRELIRLVKHPKGSWRCMRRYCLSRHDCGIPCSPPSGRLRYGVYQRLLASHRGYWSA
jgi:hypothetical protein